MRTHTSQGVHARQRSFYDMKRLHTLVLGVATLVAIQGCKEAALYTGGPPGPAAVLQLSSSAFRMAVGETAVVGARAEDEVGNAVSGTASFTSCDASKVTVSGGAAQDQWLSSATISAVALGQSCVVATEGSFVDTIQVFIGPASIVITGPDTVLSGDVSSFGLEFYAVDGSMLTPGADFPPPILTAGDSLKIALSVVDPAAYTYEGGAQQPGAVDVWLTTSPDFGSVTAIKHNVVVPGTFTGTISTTTAAVQAGFIKVTPPSSIVWDGDETVQIGTKYLGDTWDGIMGDRAVAAWYPDSILFRVPATLAAGDYDLFVLDQGPTQIASKLTFTVTGSPVTNRQVYPGDNTPGASLQDKPLPLRFPFVPEGPYGSSLDRSYYTIAPTGSAFQFTALLQFSCPGDLDIQFIDGDFTAFQGDRSGETLSCPEATVWSVPDGGFNFLRIQNFESSIFPGQMTLYKGCVVIENGSGDATDDSDNWDTAGC
jgi:hypothetical protein